MQFGLKETLSFQWRVTDFFDLVRTNQAASKINGFVEGKHEVFPIPQAEIDISGLTQNPGY